MPGTRTRARGELELVVLRLLWSAAEPLTAREIQDRFPGRVPASTTILTALDRLRAKGDVARVGHEQRGIRFAATQSEAEHASRAMLNALKTIDGREAALLKFAGNLDARDADLLRAALQHAPAAASESATAS